MTADEQLARMNTLLNVVIGAATIAVMARLLIGPDALARAKMMALRQVSRSAKVQADFWATVAANADTSYHRLRNVVV